MKELRDQAAHIAVGLVILGLAAGWPVLGIWSPLLAAFLLGVVIETKERGSTVTLESVLEALGSTRDLLGYTAAGALMTIALAAALRVSC